MVDFNSHGGFSLDDIFGADEEDQEEIERDRGSNVLKTWAIRWKDGYETTVRGHELFSDEGRLWVVWLGVGITWSGLSDRVESVGLVDPVLADLEQGE